MCTYACPSGTEKIKRLAEVNIPKNKRENNTLLLANLEGHLT